MKKKEPLKILDSALFVQNVYFVVVVNYCGKEIHGDNGDIFYENASVQPYYCMTKPELDPFLKVGDIVNIGLSHIETHVKNIILYQSIRRLFPCVVLNDVKADIEDRRHTEEYLLDAGWAFGDRLCILGDTY